MAENNNDTVSPLLLPGFGREVGGNLSLKEEVCLCDNYSVAEDTDTWDVNMTTGPATPCGSVLSSVF